MSAYFEQRMAELRANPPERKQRLMAGERLMAPQPIEEPSGGRRGYIYFAMTEDGKFVKIGFAANMTSRMQSLRTGNHQKVTIHESFVSHQEAEKMLHKRFKEYRVRGEWFKMNYDIEELWGDLMDYQGTYTPPGPNADTPGAGKEFLDRMGDTYIPLNHVKKILDYLGKPWPPGLFA